MGTIKQLTEYFSEGIYSDSLKTVGVEVETQFVTASGDPISTETSQQILSNLADQGWWKVCARKGNLITMLNHSSGDKIFYELGRHNIEVATAPNWAKFAVSTARRSLNELYSAAEKTGAYPYFGSVLPGEEDLLVIPDKRDAVWLELDGRERLAPLARTSSVQFTVSLAVEDAINVLNRLGDKASSFLEDFPQDEVWKRYIAESSAGYREDRYGGPLIFGSLHNYCKALASHDVVSGSRLVPYTEVQNVDIPLHIRSVWWHFRLKRYGNALCVEVRPLARREDEMLQDQLEKTLGRLSY